MAVGNSLSRSRIAALTLLILLSIVCIGLGAVPWRATMARYFEDGFGYQGMEAMQLVTGVFGTGLMAIGLLFAGVALRVSKWSASPKASLALCAFSIGFLAITLLILLQSELAIREGGHELLAMVLLPSLLVAVVPPFQHWLSARRRMAAGDELTSGS